MRVNKKLFYSFLAIAVAIFTLITIFCFGKYKYIEENSFTDIQITHNNNNIRYEGFTIYAEGQTENNFNYQRPYKLKPVNDSVLSVKLDDSLKLKSFRCYFEYAGEKIEITSIDLLSVTKNHTIDLNQEFESHGLKWTTKEGKLKFEVSQVNGFLDTPKQFLYPSNFKNIYQFLIPIIIVILFLTYLVYNINFSKINLRTIGVKEVSLAILILSEFLPAPIYNIALILGVVLNIRRISFKNITQNKVNLLFILFFVIYLINNLFISKEGYTSLRTIERFLPFLILSIILPTIANRKYLVLFPVSAIAIGTGLLVTSIFEVFVNGNMVFVSFSDFTKYLHPVYFSYLLFFSICYIDLAYKNKLKYILELILFIFLIFSGSKMVFLFSLIVVLINLIKNKKLLIVIFPLIIVVLLFSPLKKRFDEILKIEDLTILSEKHINNPNDARINGLTLRLLLWREALATMNTKDFFIGKGVTKETNKTLSKRLSNLGLKSHVGFNPHNQYVDTFWRTGFLGFFVLIAIPFYSFALGLRNKDKLLIQFSLFMIAVMFSESIFGRVNGIYFFTTVILILINSSQLHENRNIRN